jgi:hypothetical protein
MGLGDGLCERKMRNSNSMSALDALTKNFLSFADTHREEIGRISQKKPIDEHTRLAQKALRMIIEERRMGLAFRQQKVHDIYRIEASIANRFARCVSDGLMEWDFVERLKVAEWCGMMMHFATQDMAEKEVEVSPWYLDEVGGICQTKDGRILLKNSWQKEVWEATKAEYLNGAPEEYGGNFWKRQLVDMYVSIASDSTLILDKDLNRFLSEEDRLSILSEVWKRAKTGVLLFLIDECDCAPLIDPRFSKKLRGAPANLYIYEADGVGFSSVERQALKSAAERWGLRKEKLKLMGEMEVFQKRKTAL